MQTFRNEDSSRGDLARDMYDEQERSPFRICDDLNGIVTWEHMQTYLRTARACDDCIRTAKRCWQDYMKSLDCA